MADTINHRVIQEVKYLIDIFPQCFNTLRYFWQDIHIGQPLACLAAPKEQDPSIDACIVFWVKPAGGPVFLRNVHGRTILERR